MASNVLAKLTKAYGESERRVMVVEEIGETIYTRDMTVGDKDKVNKHVQRSKSDMSMYVYAMIFMLENKEGEKLFTLEDYQALMNNVDSLTILKIGEFIYGFDEKK